ncbi:reverse transcriptase [Phytophthora megakarya]|uniref:Reverse transcriptase n=1 Tax=Phytophthora megakarya TaxID=4795 RepID=A0A225UQS2_9STRA|nr:reverse transcriptase [Phytophthora megakarya]
MSTADYPQADGQTKRVNRVLVDLLKSYAQSFDNWSDYLPMAEFAINNAVHTSTGHTPFFVNAMRHPRLPNTLGADHAQSGTDATTSGESVQDTDADKINELDPGFSSQAMDFVHERQAVVRFVQDAIAASADRQKLNADNV